MPSCPVLATLLVKECLKETRCLSSCTGVEQAVGVLLNAAAIHYPEIAAKEALVPLAGRVLAELEPHAKSGGYDGGLCQGKPCAAALIIPGLQHRAMSQHDCYGKEYLSLG